VRQLTDDPQWDSWWPRISPDRSTVVFYRTPAGSHDRDFTRTSLWAIGADGSGAVLVRPAGLDKWPVQGHAEWAPDGQSLVMFGGPNRSNPQIFLTDRLGQNPRQITDRPGSNLDPSFAPDGRTIVFVGCPERFCTPGDQEVYTVPVAGGDATRITHDGIRDNDPYYSPDGTQLAWLSQISGVLVGSWDIRIAPAAGGADPRRLVGDDNVNSRPQWSADGRTIYFHRSVKGSGNGFQVWSIGVDGTDPREITAGQPGTNEYPAT
jgi:Tol biopolymer transport system component